MSGSVRQTTDTHVPKNTQINSLGRSGRTISDSRSHSTLAPSSRGKVSAAESKLANSITSLRPRDKDTSSSAQRPSVPQQDVLRIAAEAYAWQYMTTSLNYAHQNTTEETLAFLRDHSDSLAVEEAEVEDARVRYEAEQILELCDELADPRIREGFPTLFHSFSNFEASHEKVTTEALTLGSLPSNAISLQKCNDVFDGIDTLENTLLEIKTDTIGLTEIARGQLPRLYAFLGALLPLLRERLTTLDIARAVVETSKNNIRAQLQLEIIRS